ADRDKVRQVLVNLVENAIKYSPGGGRIEVGIELGAEAEADMVTFFVRDEGLGIPPDEQARIFEKFYRLDPHMTRGVGGTGLGLYICNELVNRMGGHIWVESSEGVGSTFLLSLPTEAKLSVRQPPRAARGESDRELHPHDTCPIAPSRAARAEPRLRPLHARPADRRRRRVARRPPLRRAAGCDQPGRVPRDRGAAEAAREPGRDEAPARSRVAVPAASRPSCRHRG